VKALFLSLTLLLLGGNLQAQTKKPPAKKPPVPVPAVIIDSKMTRKEALGKNSFPQEFIDQMEVVTVDYFGFDEKHHRGQIVVNKDVAKEVKVIFGELFKAKYPIKLMIPIVKYGWHDQKSINVNNTSAFNYRKVIGPGTDPTKLSNHSYGRAIDLNPYQNPFVNAKGVGPRPYKPGVKGTITKGDAATKAFAKYGWEWGGSFDGPKDYQHFQKKGKLTIPK
jgi:hypothetical protein